MVEAKEDVNKMKAELAIKNQELAAASKEAEALLQSISESTAVAEKGTGVGLTSGHAPLTLDDGCIMCCCGASDLLQHCWWGASTLTFCHCFMCAEKQKVAVIVDQVSRKAAEIGAVRDDAETDLSAAKPALEEALSALNSITPKDIVSLKALKSPPDIVKRIFDAVLLLRHWPIDKVCVHIPAQPQALLAVVVE
jgi:dynein heavy chain, axonemal